MAKRVELGRLLIGDSFQVQKGGRAYTIHDKVCSNSNYDDERIAVFSAFSVDRYIICVGPKGLCVFTEEKMVIELSKGPAHEQT